MFDIANAFAIFDILLLSAANQKLNIFFSKIQRKQMQFIEIFRVYISMTR